MHSALYLSSALLLWPLLISALPLPTCLDTDLSPEDGSCDFIEHYPIHWAIDEGHLRLKARAAEGPAHGSAVPALEPRGDVVELAVAEPEGPVRRDAEAISIMGKEEPRVDTRDRVNLKERWIIQEMEEAEVPGAGPEVSTDGGPESTPGKRWTIAPPADGWDRAAVSSGDSTPPES